MLPHERPPEVGDAVTVFLKGDVSGVDRSSSPHIGRVEYTITQTPRKRSERGTPIPAALYIADRGTPSYQTARLSADVACAGDSLTGWNNFGVVGDWPYRTYPEFLQQLCDPLRLTVANGGIAGEVSDNGLGQVEDYLGLFPNARWFVVGYGTNDLGMGPEVEWTSPRILGNLDAMVRAIRDGGRQPILPNVPYANESLFAGRVAEDLHRARDYHNDRLGAYCLRERVPLVEIAAKLRDEHFADKLHPSDEGAQVIAQEVFRVLNEVR